jgi:hypothetical protein
MALIRQVYHDAKWYGQGNASNKDLSLEAFNTNKNLVQIFNSLIMYYFSLRINHI